MLLPPLFILYFDLMSTNQLKSDPIKTILVITVGMLVVYVATKWHPALVIALVIGLSGILSSYLAVKIDFLWMKLTWVLSLIVPNILLSIIFYVLLTPIALLSRIFSKEDQLFLKNNSQSIFKEYNKQFDKDSFKNPW